MHIENPEILSTGLRTTEAKDEKALKKDACGHQQVDSGDAEASGSAQKVDELTKHFNFSFDHELSPPSHNSEFLLNRPT